MGSNDLEVDDDPAIERMDAELDRLQDLIDAAEDDDVDASAFEQQYHQTQVNYQHTIENTYFRQDEEE
ncbi:hypothetical protein A2368_03230 [Candidatus Collierbacteria bacterium RIFOXYB1_FULL_49_13]|uniref:Uncharacterized protein n=1 Tax=Candidatus Collierbacteria bacterium RIFOXYB1_FULL_49_13 TaxID=1817728 RepID=A0A1F5FK43_9BACT|nr:MAG: hypothetical protein A2368_03230 [Candidatus Collierbacteria bacterium RIFOXYB1_FULL_49_13]